MTINQTIKSIRKEATKLTSFEKFQKQQINNAKEISKLPDNDPRKIEYIQKNRTYIASLVAE